MKLFEMICERIQTPRGKKEKEKFQEQHSSKLCKIHALLGLEEAYPGDRDKLSKCQFFTLFLLVSFPPPVNKCFLTN